jgi:hypothetical protein
VNARVALVAALALGLGLSGAGPVRADGDPASDTLVLQNVFLPYEPWARTTADALSRQVHAAYAAGYRVKVAVIATKVDLGAIPSLFGKPGEYARFLGEELSGYYVGPLLIVMPAGYGVYDGGRSTQAENGVLAGLPHPASPRPNDLLAAATTAVGRLLGAGALKSTDILPPFVQLLAASVKAHTLSLRYYLFDDSGNAAVTLTATKGTQTLYSVQIAAHATQSAKPEQHAVVLPPGLALAGARVCVAGVDAAGNQSPRSCKRLALR